MTITQKRKLLIRIQQVESDISTLENVRIDLLKSGFASATLASGGGSKSYTRLDVGKVTSAISVLQKELAGLQALLSGGHSTQYKTILTVYDC